MRTTFIRSIVLISTVLTGLSAQQAVTTVPRVVRVSSTFVPSDGGKPAPVEGVILSIYREGQGGAPLWQETQNVSVDSEGRYNVLLGATVNDGVPMELFTSGEQRWLGVRFNRPGETEQPRTLLTSVPFALRASDAETLGGLPATAFLRDPSASPAPGVAAAASANLTPNAPKPRAALGTPGYIAAFTDATDLGNSVMYQQSGLMGVNTTTPLDYFHVAFNNGNGAATGYAVQNLSPTGYSGMLFYDQSGALGQFQGFSNSTHEYRINNIASGGTINFMINFSSKFQVLNSGNINLGGSLQSGGNVVFQLGQLSNFSLGVGPSALSAGNTGVGNVAVGASALGANTGGLQNTAFGYNAMVDNTGGSNNVALGQAALLHNTTGNDNTADGVAALDENTTGSNNIALGYFAAVNVSGGNSNNIHIGTQGSSGDSGIIRIGGNTALGDPVTQTSLYAPAVSNHNLGSDINAVPVVVDTTNGLMGFSSSSRRYKEDIRDMGEASSDLMRLRPVTFRYEKPAPDGSKPIQYGLIAEEVAEVYPDLVAHSADGQIETVRYQVLDSMLLNELQRQQARIEQLERQIEELKNAVSGQGR